MWAVICCSSACCMAAICSRSASAVTNWAPAAGAPLSPRRSTTLLPLPLPLPLPPLLLALLSALAASALLPTLPSSSDATHPGGAVPSLMRDLRSATPALWKCGKQQSARRPKQHV